MSRIFYKVAIGGGRHLRTNFKKKSTAKKAAAHYAHGRVSKHRRAKHGHGR